MSLCDLLICFADFVGMILLAVLFLLPLTNCFLKVCLTTLFAAVLKFFLPLTTSATRGAAKSNQSAATSFEAGTTYLRKNGIATFPITFAMHRIHVHVVDQHLYRIESLLVFKQPSCNVFYVRIDCWKLFRTSKQND